VITHYYQDESVTLYCADSLRVLSELPTGSVDAVITDPPYSSGGFTRADRSKDTRSKYVDNDAKHDLKDFAGDNRDQRGYEYWMTLWLSESLRVVKPGGVCVLFTDWRQLPVTTDALQAGGYIWRGIVPWAKTTYRPQSGRFAAQCEYVAWGSRGVMETDYTLPSLPGFYLVASPREREHITQKPLEVMQSLVKIVPEGGTVFDPFMGAGTTGVAAVMEGRKFVGVEMTDHYAEIAQRRIVTAVQGYKPQGDQMVLGVDAP
jgi:site-specific DNA-methyltransferase (adenine-specific)